MGTDNGADLLKWYQISVVKGKAYSVGMGPVRTMKTGREKKILTFEAERSYKREVKDFQ